MFTRYLQLLAKEAQNIRIILFKIVVILADSKLTLVFVCTKCLKWTKESNEFVARLLSRVVKFELRTKILKEFLFFFSRHHLNATKLMFIVSKMTFDCRWERDDRSHARDFSKQNKSETLLDVFVYLECFVLHSNVSEDEVFSGSLNKCFCQKVVSGQKKFMWHF